MSNTDGRLILKYFFLCVSGTTLNLLKFPIVLPPSDFGEARAKRLAQARAEERRLIKTQRENVDENKKLEPPKLIGQ